MKNKTKKVREYNTRYRKAIADVKFLNKQRSSFLSQIDELEERNKLLQGTIETWENLFDKILKKFKVRNIKQLEDKLFGLDGLIIETEKICCSNCRKPIEIVLKNYGKKTLKSWTSICMECLNSEESNYKERIKELETDLKDRKKLNSEGKQEAMQSEARHSSQA